MRPLESGLHLRSWRLEHRLGIGAHGDVWMATNSRGDQVALKIRPHSDDAQSIRFRKEFERLRTLRLPGVIRVLDTGVDQGYIYFAMELARGARWDHYLDASKSIEQRIRRAIDAGAGIARILASIHQLHLAHRDIKPANVHVEAEPTGRSAQVTLLDFGTHRFGSLRDEDGDLVGTPAYMSPEQRLGMPHDQRGDCYALGVLLYEAISQTKNSKHPVGRPRPSLTRIGPSVPLAVADLVDRLLRLDPADRPTAAEAEAVLRAITSGMPLTPAPWPRPISHTGDPSALLQGSGVVVGPPGCGQKRLVNEARWQWYSKGYRSVAATCTPDEVYGAWRVVMDELFREQDPVRRRALAGTAGGVLRAIWPNLPVPVDAHLEQRPNPQQVAQAIAEVLQRCQPIAIVLHDLDRADLGTAQVIAQLAGQEPDKLRLWATASSPCAELPTFEPPPWNDDAAAAAWADLVPGLPVPTVLPEHPIDGLCAAWRAFAKARSLPQPPKEIPPSLIRLSALQSPFPRSVAVHIAPDLDDLIDAGHLVGLDTEAEGPTARIRFRSAATRELARLQPCDRPAVHRLAYEAWKEEADSPEVIRARAHHAFRGDKVSEELLKAVIKVALVRGDASEIRRWLELQQMHCDPVVLEQDGQGFIEAYAQLFVDLTLHPSRVHRDHLRELAASAETPEHRGMAGYLKLKHASRGEDRVRIATEGRKWAKSLETRHPSLAARMLRETALVHLGSGKVDSALSDAQRALELARRAASNDEEEVTEQHGTETTQIAHHQLTQPEVDAAITYSAALVYSGEITQAADLAGSMARRSVAADRPRGAASFLTNQAIALHRLGQRAEAADCVAEARALHHRHLDPDVFANWAVIAARLAVERGDLPAGSRLLGEAITAGQATQGADLLGEAWTISLDAAAQSGRPEEAQRALAAYGTDTGWSVRDHWPAALARWHWAIGDLDTALKVTQTQRIGFGGACVEAERARLLLVSGQSEDAIRACRAALGREGAEQYQDLHIFLRLVLGAAETHHDGDYVPLISQTRQRQWVHLYLGALHLDAIRRRRRGENVSPVLRQLEDRSADVGHTLYRALSRSSGW